MARGFITGDLVRFPSGEVATIVGFLPDGRMQFDFGGCIAAFEKPRGLRHFGRQTGPRVRAQLEAIAAKPLTGRAEPLPDGGLFTEREAI